jgi:hypothetical protein
MTKNFRGDEGNMGFRARAEDFHGEHGDHGGFRSKKPDCKSAPQLFLFPNLVLSVPSVESVLFPNPAHPVSPWTSAGFGLLRNSVISVPSVEIFSSLSPGSH